MGLLKKREWRGASRLNDQPNVCNRKSGLSADVPLGGKWKLDLCGLREHHAATSRNFKCANLVRTSNLRRAKFQRPTR